MTTLIPFATLAAVCGIACLTDLRSHRIPNAICIVALVVGVACQLFDGIGIGSVLLSALVPFILFIPFYALGGMAAGDVKLMVGCGALIGWPFALLATGFTLMFGTVLGCAVYVSRGGIHEFLARYGGAARMLLATGSPQLPAAGDGSVAKSRFPYAVAIALGSISAALLSSYS